MKGKAQPICLSQVNHRSFCYYALLNKCVYIRNIYPLYFSASYVEGSLSVLWGILPVSKTAIFWTKMSTSPLPWAHQWSWAIWLRYLPNSFQLFPQPLLWLYQSQSHPVLLITICVSIANVCKPTVCRYSNVCSLYIWYGITISIKWLFNWLKVDFL